METGPPVQLRVVDAIEQEALLSLLHAPAADTSRRAGACDCLAHRYGNAANRPMRIPVYPTDLTDAQRALVAPLVAVPGWTTGCGGGRRATALGRWPMRRSTPMTT